MISKRWTILLFALIALTPKSGMSEAQVYTITDQVAVYNYTTHAYSIEQKDKGVRFSYVASGNDSLAIIVETMSGQGTYYKAIDFYGTDQTFTTPAGSRNGNSTIVFPFKPNSSQRYYFIVRHRQLLHIIMISRYISGHDAQSLLMLMVKVPPSHHREALF